MENNNSADDPLSGPPQLQEEDRISKLHDDLLNKILSMLTFKEAAQTSILSHRWMSLWMRVPRLHFVTTLDKHDVANKEKRNSYMAVFANLVNRALDLRGRSYLQEFKIVCELDKTHRNDIDKWLKYALGLGVERLELSLARAYSTQISDHLYDFPNKLLIRQITRLGVQQEVSFSCLRELCFISVNISGEAIECLLFMCPLLEHLRVLYSKVLVNVVVSGPSLLLKYLEIIDCVGLRSIKISNTNIISIRVSVLSDRPRLMLDNLPMLTKVWITGILPEKSVLFSQLSCCLPQLTTLTLQSFHIKEILDLYKLPELQNLRRMVLISFGWYKSLIGLTSFIESCPNLVEFALMLQPMGGANERSYRDQKPANEESVKSLKVFEYYGYHGKYEYEDELLMFLIEKAVALEKIVIDPRENHVGHGGGVPTEDERSRKSRSLVVEKYTTLVPKHVEFVVV